MMELSVIDPEAIPYVLDVRSVANESGKWVCRVSYDGLPGCVAEDSNILVALDKLERKRQANVWEYFQQTLAAAPGSL